MPAFLAGLAALLILVFGARLLASANPQTLAPVLRKSAGVVLLLLALFLIARGALPLAIPLAFFGLALLGMKMGSLFGGGGPFGSSNKSRGQTSEVRTDALEMMLDHDTGQMEGRCLKGQFAGSTFSSLSDEDLLVLLKELRGSDEQGAVLIEAYLDRRAQGRREGPEDAARDQTRHPQGARGRMTREEAYEVLGIAKGADEDEIRAAHRKLMMKLHPDQGGSTYLAARINEAKDVLVGRK
jgi:DnaJ-domain-containing protein 1